MTDRLKSSSGNMHSQIGLKLHDINAIVSSCDSMLKIAAHTRDQAKILQRQITELSRSNPGRAILRRQSSAKPPPTTDAHPIRVAVAPKQMIDSETTSNSSFVSGPDAVGKPAKLQQRAATQHAADRSHLGVTGATRPQSVAICPPQQQQRLKNISTLAAPKPNSGRQPNFHHNAHNATAATRRAQQQKHEHQMLTNRKAHHTFLVRRQQPPKSNTGAAGQPQLHQHQQQPQLPKVESAPQPQLQQLSAMAGVAPPALQIGQQTLTANGQRVTSSRAPADNVAFI